MRRRWSSDSRYSIGKKEEFFWTSFRTIELTSELDVTTTIRETAMNGGQQLILLSIEICRRKKENAERRDTSSDRFSFLLPENLSTDRSTWLVRERTRSNRMMCLIEKTKKKLFLFVVFQLCCKRNSNVYKCHHRSWSWKANEPSDRLISCASPEIERTDKDISVWIRGFDANRWTEGATFRHLLVISSFICSLNYSIDVWARLTPFDSFGRWRWTILFNQIIIIIIFVTIGHQPPRRFELMWHRLRKGKERKEEKPSMIVKLPSLPWKSFFFNRFVWMR